jgi:hypothetical protein
MRLVLSSFNEASQRKVGQLDNNGTSHWGYCGKYVLNDRRRDRLRDGGQDGLQQESDLEESKA